MSDARSPADGDPPSESTSTDGDDSSRNCLFNPIANRHEWWEPGIGFTGEPCRPTTAPDSGFGHR